APAGGVLESSARPRRAAPAPRGGRGRTPPGREPPTAKSTLRSQKRKVFVGGPQLLPRRREGRNLLTTPAWPAAGSPGSRTARLRSFAGTRGRPRVAPGAACLPAVWPAADTQRHRGFRVDRDRGAGLSPTHSPPPLPAHLRLHRRPPHHHRPAAAEAD